MDQIIGTITLPLFILFAFCVMLGIKPNIVTRPLLNLMGSVAGMVFSLCGLAFNSMSCAGSTINKPKPRFRSRTKFTD